jgi:integrase
MPKSFSFTEPKIRELIAPATGRAYHKDEKFPGLQICVTESGTKTYYFVKRIAGKPTRIRLGNANGLTVEAARNAAAAITGDLAAGRNPQEDRRVRRQEPTLKDLWEHWKLYAEAHKRPRSFDEDKRNYKNHLARLESRRLSTIKKSDVQNLHARIGRKSGIYAANRVLALLRAMLNKAEEIGYRGSNSARGVKQFKETSRDRFLHPDELKKFFDALSRATPLFRDFFLTCLLTGARKTNVLTMQWIDIDFHAGVWRIPMTKSGSPVVVPLVIPVLELLSERRNASDDSPWVFPGHKRGTHLVTPTKAWKAIIDESGLSDVRPHDLRRSLGSWMAIRGSGLPIIGKLLGHRRESTTQIYARLTVDPVRAAAEEATNAMLLAGSAKMESGAMVVTAQKEKHDAKQ